MTWLAWSSNSRVLDLGNRISAERAPSNVFMATELLQAADAQGPLMAARGETDQAIALTSGIIPAAQIQSVVQGLVRETWSIRLRAKGHLAMLLCNRRPMLSSRRMTPIRLSSCRRPSLIRSDPELAGPVRHALILCVLRDDAGRLGSTIIAPLIAREAIPLSNIAAGERLAGRIARYLAVAGAQSRTGGSSFAFGHVSSGSRGRVFSWDNHWSTG
jgi:uncharacterized membrane protein YgcG